MRALVCAGIMFALSQTAGAQPRYDRKLEEAVMTIVAEKIGDIRGSFDFGAEPAMVAGQDRMKARRNPTISSPPPPEGLARATERRTPQAPF